MAHPYKPVPEPVNITGLLVRYLLSSLILIYGTCMFGLDMEFFSIENILISTGLLLMFLVGILTNKKINE